MSRHVIPRPTGLPLGGPVSNWAPEEQARYRAAVRNFVYRLHDADGAVLYVGRSTDVPNRLRNHLWTARKDPRKAEWFYRVRSVSMVGPFNHDDADTRELAEIDEHQPCGNRVGTKRWVHPSHRHLVAAADPSP